VARLWRGIDLRGKEGERGKGASGSCQSRGEKKNVEIGARLGGACLRRREGVRPASVRLDTSGVSGRGPRRET
jgi:hypothetical protein